MRAPSSIIFLLRGCFTRHVLHPDQKEAVLQVTSSNPLLFVLSLQISRSAQSILSSSLPPSQLQELGIQGPSELKFSGCHLMAPAKNLHCLVTVYGVKIVLSCLVFNLVATSL